MTLFALACALYTGSPFIPRQLEQCHDVELNPGPRPAPATNGTSNGNNRSRASTGSSTNSNDGSGVAAVNKRERSSRPPPSNNLLSPSKAWSGVSRGRGSLDQSEGGGGGGGRLEKLGTCKRKKLFKISLLKNMKMQLLYLPFVTFLSN